MRFKIVTMIAAAALLSACSTAPSDQGDATASSASSGAAASSVKAPIAGSQQDLVVNVGDRVFFGFDKYDLTPTARNTLQMQAAWLTANPSVNITIEGHCDERGTREYNLALGERRANASRDYLLSLGVADSRITTISYGKERPVALGANENAWAQNRRGVTAVK